MPQQFGHTRLVVQLPLEHASRDTSLRHLPPSTAIKQRVMPHGVPFLIRVKVCCRIFVCLQVCGLKVDHPFFFFQSIRGEHTDTITNTNTNFACKFGFVNPHFPDQLGPICDLWHPCLHHPHVLLSFPQTEPHRSTLLCDQSWSVNH